MRGEQILGIPAMGDSLVHMSPITQIAPSSKAALGLGTATAH